MSGGMEREYCSRGAGPCLLCWKANNVACDKGGWGREVWSLWGCVVVWGGLEGGRPEAWDGVLLGDAPQCPQGSSCVWLPADLSLTVPGDFRARRAPRGECDCSSKPLTLEIPPDV